MLEVDMWPAVNSPIPAPDTAHWHPFLTHLPGLFPKKVLEPEACPESETGGGKSLCPLEML